LILGLTVAAASLSQTPLTSDTANLTKKQTLNGTSPKSTGIFTPVSTPFKKKNQSIPTSQITKTGIMVIPTLTNLTTVANFFYYNNKKVGQFFTTENGLNELKGIDNFSIPLYGIKYGIHKDDILIFNLDGSYDLIASDGTTTHIPSPWENPQYYKGKLADIYSSDNYKVINISFNSCLAGTKAQPETTVGFKESCARGEGNSSSSYFIIDKNANITTLNDFVIYWNITGRNPFTNMKGTGTSELIELIYPDGTRIIYIDEASKPLQFLVGDSNPSTVLKGGDTILEFPDGTYYLIKNDLTFVSHMNKVKDNISRKVGRVGCIGLCNPSREQLPDDESGNYVQVNVSWVKV